MLLPGVCKSMGFWISSASSTGQRLLSEREDFQGMKTKPTQTYVLASLRPRASRHLCQSLPVVLGFGYLCPSPSLPLGVRLLCLRGMVVKRIVSQYVLPHMWRAHLNQTGGLQGFCDVSCENLADNDLGTGSGWQQSRQNWMPPAVMRYWVRM